MLSWESLSRITALGLFFTLCIGPWTPVVFSKLALGEFEAFSVIDMTVWLLGRMWLTYYAQWSLIVVPLLIVCCRAVFPIVVDTGQWVLILFAECASLIGLPLLLLDIGRDDATTNPIADVLFADLVGMVVVHASLIGFRILPPWTFSCGPLYGLCYTLRLSESKRYSSPLAAGLLLYASIGTLHRAYRMMKALYGHELFEQTHSFDEWLGTEMYAALTVILGYFVIFFSLQVPRTWRSLSGVASILELILYTVLVNANVGAGWIVPSGIFRPSLQRPILVRCLLPRSWKPHV